MVIISIKQNMTWLCLKYVPTHNFSIHYRTGNVYLHCCESFPCIAIPNQVSNKNNSSKYPTICFHVYTKVSRCTVNGIYTPNELFLCSAAPKTVPSAKIYTRKEIVLTKTSMSNFHKSFYMTAIKS